ncbi:hypothetical protein [Vibrio phage BONAISHI]|nr:hypothetical protein [Vibrio phage BONAISHI]
MGKKQKWRVGPGKLDHNVPTWIDNEKTIAGHIIEAYSRLMLRIEQKNFCLGQSLMSSQRFYDHVMCMGYDKDLHVIHWTGESLGRQVAQIEDIVLVPKRYLRIFPVNTTCTGVMYVHMGLKGRKHGMRIYSYQDDKYIQRSFDSPQMAHYAALKIRIADINVLLEDDSLHISTVKALMELKEILQTAMNKGLAYFPRGYPCLDKHFGETKKTYVKGEISLMALCKGRV